MHNFNFLLVKLIFLRFLLPIENQKSQKLKKIFCKKKWKKSFEFNFFLWFLLAFLVIFLVLAYITTTDEYVEIIVLR